MKKKIINGLKYWGQLLLLPVYWLSFLVPGNKNIWVFGSTFGRRFADNPRYFYLYVSQHSAYQSDKLVQRVDAWKKEGHEWKADENCLSIRAVWISHNKEIVSFLQSNGYEAYYYHSLKGIWMALRAGVYLFDNYSKDINFWQSGRALKVNMWHGIPLKKIQADNRFDLFRHPKNSWEKFKCFPRNLSDEKPSHYVLTTSEFMRPIFSSAFRTEHVLVSGYPRNDRLISDVLENVLPELEEKELEKIISFRERDGRGKMVYYMPTFRDSEKKFFDVMQLESFQQFLKENHILFCVKLHPKSKLNAQFKELQGEAIQVIDKDADPYTFLEEADVLVTDYSSIYFDFLLTDKPVVFFDYDLEEYLSDTREMYFDYEAFTPGMKAKNQEELEEALKEAVCHQKVTDMTENEKYQEIKRNVFDETQNAASPRMVQDIKDILKIR